MNDRRFLRCLLGATLLTWSLGCSPAERPPQAPATVDGTGAVRIDELRLATDTNAVLIAARALMEADSAVALATADAAGQPRVRTVRATLEPMDSSRPASGFTVWVKTRFTTRKVDQIRANPQVTLYFNDDEKESYATIMGTAVVHTDPEHPGAKRHYDPKAAAVYWPAFPEDFVMLEIRPRWLEFIGPGIADDERTWRPQAVVFQ